MDITDINTIFGPFPAQRAGGDAAALVSAMQAAGVDYALSLSSRGVFYSDADGNADTLASVKAQPGLVPVATFNPSHFTGNADAVSQVSTQGFELCRFFPATQGWPVDFAPFTKLLTHLRLLERMPIMVETHRAGDITQLERAAEGFPHPVILEGVSEHNLSEALCVLRRQPTFYLETHRLPPALPFIAGEVGVGRLLFGSGAPGLSLGAALRVVRGSHLSDAEQEAVLGGNLGKIFGGGE